jgi:serine/threonine protein kinase
MLLLEVGNVPVHNMKQNRYEILSTIGVGATSRVDKAHDTLIDRTVALKTFGHGFGSEELQKQFVREAQILGRLSHPNVVSIYDLGTNEDGSAYLVMEFVPGKTLEGVMASQGVLPLSRVGVWAGDLANALNRAHRAGIIHGDVKPANIFITEDGHIKLGDFGIARFATQLSGTGKLVGTPAYLSPEQIKGESQDHRSDIFSLGIILYQLATGVRPFDGSSVTAVCAQIVASEPAPPSRRNPELPKEFDRVVMRCLSKDPAKRYASGESLAASLYPFARSKAEAAPNRIDFSWWKKPLRPRDAWISFAACSMAIFGLGFAIKSNLQKTWHATTGSSLLAAASTNSSNPLLQIELPIRSDQNTTIEYPNLAAQESVPARRARREHDASARATRKKESGSKAKQSNRSNLGGHAAAPSATAGEETANTSDNPLASSPVKPAGTGNAVHSAAIAQVPLNIEIASAIDGETLAIYADQHLVATSPLSVTASGESLHLEHALPAGPHEFRVALYRADQSLHLERGGLAEIQPGNSNLLSIKVVRHAKMLVKHDASLEILWPRAVAKAPKSGVAVADASTAAHTSR